MARQNFLAPPYYSQRAMFVSHLSAFFILHVSLQYVIISSTSVAVMQVRVGNWMSKTSKIRSSFICGA